MQAALYLFPVTLGDCEHSRVLPPYNRELILGIRHFIVENLRSARRFLKREEPSIDIDKLIFYELNEHTTPEDRMYYLEALEHGLPMGLLSEAGCPAVADPGADIVDEAQRKGLRVIPLVGPSSILLALMASGFNGQSFAFLGYLPIRGEERAAAIREMETRAYKQNQTQIFIEAPYRNHRLFDELLRVCNPQTRICVAADLTCADENIRTLSIAEWKQTPLPDFEKKPSIFLLYK
jgi:16S rRNA (cytidine1402-2'-O)-methyltransferase